jgi:hypothetical protein
VEAVVNTGQVSQRLLAFLTWAAATALATAIGFVTVTTAGDVLRGTGPLGGDLSSADDPEAPGEPTTPPTARTFTHELANVRARCHGRSASLTGVDLARGTRLRDKDLGPDEDVHIEVLRGGVVTRLEVYCNHGQPRFFVDRPAGG